MSDELEPLRRLRADRAMPDDILDPGTLAQAKANLMASIGTPAEAEVFRTPAVYPRLAYLDEMAALAFLTRAFGFQERRESRMEHPDGTLAWLEMGDGVVMIGRAGEERHGLHSPSETGGRTAMVNVTVGDVDAHCSRARAEGAHIVSEPEDMFWGERRYEALDLEGHRWHFAQRLKTGADEKP
ncbi:MAG: VOC family protein [Acidimicrobiales bacterium]